MISYKKVVSGAVTAACLQFLSISASQCQPVVDSSSSESSAPPPSASAQPLDNWSGVNTKFREFYAQNRKRHLDSLSPVILVIGDEVILLREGKRKSLNVISPQYTLLKTVDHIPLAIFVKLTDFTEKSGLDKSTLEDLEKFRHHYATAKSELEKWKEKFSQITYNRQLELIDASSTFLDQVMKQQRVSREQLQKFARASAKMIFANVDEAVEQELSTIDAQVRQWRSEMTEEEWNKTYVVISSGHMPRDQNRVMQYFLKLLHERREGGRVIYDEGPPFDEAGALELLATHVIDKQIAIDFFDDPWRMHRDLLSDGAKKYLKKHPPRWNK